MNDKTRIQTQDYLSTIQALDVYPILPSLGTEGNMKNVLSSLLSVGLARGRILIPSFQWFAVYPQGTHVFGAQSIPAPHAPSLPAMWPFLPLSQKALGMLRLLTSPFF